MRKNMTAAVVFNLAAIVFCAGAQAMSLSDIRTQIRRNVRDTSTDSTLQRYSNAVLLSYINEAQKEINALTWVVQQTTSPTLTANTTYYTMPDAFLAAKQVTWRKKTTGVVTEIKEISERVLRQSNPDYERQAAGSPVNYFIRMPTDGSNNLQLGIVPAPNSSSTGTLRVDYVAQPADLSSDSDTPFDGYLSLAPYHGALVYQVSAKLKMIEGKPEEAMKYDALYAMWLQLMGEKTGTRPNYNPGAIGGQPNR